MSENPSAPAPTPPVRELGELAGEPPRPSRVRKWLGEWRRPGAGRRFTLSRVYPRGAACAYVVDEPAVKADAIVVLGAAPISRPFAAARLFHEGYSCLFWS
jgi:hypothetical protein